MEPHSSGPTSFAPITWNTPPPIWPNELRVIIFDLDDTLLDTSRLLLPIRYHESKFVRRIQSPLPPMAGALAVLSAGQTRFIFHLLTQGQPTYQKMKVRALGLAAYFTAFHFVDPQKGQSKAQVFAKLCQQYPPTQMMSIGNRLSTDLIPAKKLGLWTCWFCYGEAQDEQGTDEQQKPDFIVYSHHDILSLCHLFPVTS